MHGSCSSVRIIASQHNLREIFVCNIVSGGSLTKAETIKGSSSPYELTSFIAPEDIQVIFCFEDNPSV